MEAFPPGPPFDNPPEDLFDDPSSSTIAGHQPEEIGLIEEPIDPDEDLHTDSDPENDDFYFESDHLALRGNSDYTAVLRTIAILQTQRIQVTKDIDLLATAERQGLDDPDAFVRRLSAGELLMPGPVSVAEVSGKWNIF